MQAHQEKLAKVTCSTFTDHKTPQASQTLKTEGRERQMLAGLIRRQSLSPQSCNERPSGGWITIQGGRGRFFMEGRMLSNMKICTINTPQVVFHQGVTKVVQIPSSIQVF